MAMRSKTSAESFAALHQQVIGLDGDYQELKSVVVSLDRKMDSGFAAINTKLDEKNRTPWAVVFSALAFILAFCVSIGTLAYMPIKSDTENLRQAQVRDVDRLDTRDQRIWVRVNEIQRQLDKLDGSLHPIR